MCLWSEFVFWIRFHHLLPFIPKHEGEISIFPSRSLHIRSHIENLFRLFSVSLWRTVRMAFVASTNRSEFLGAGVARSVGKCFVPRSHRKKSFYIFFAYSADGWRRVISYTIFFSCDWITAHGMNWDNMFIISGCIHVTLNYLPLLLVHILKNLSFNCAMHYALTCIYCIMCGVVYLRVFINYINMIISISIMRDIAT